MTVKVLFLHQKTQMIQYTIKLSKIEVEELRNIINKGKHSSQACTILAGSDLLHKCRKFLHRQKPAEIAAAQATA